MTNDHESFEDVIAEFRRVLEASTEGTGIAGVRRARDGQQVVCSFLLDAWAVPEGLWHGVVAGFRTGREYGVSPSVFERLAAEGILVTAPEDGWFVIHEGVVFQVRRRGSCDTVQRLVCLP